MARTIDEIAKDAMARISTIDVPRYKKLFAQEDCISDTLAGHDEEVFAIISELGEVNYQFEEGETIFCYAVSLMWSYLLDKGYIGWFD